MKKLFRIALAIFAVLAAAVLIRFAMLGHASKSGEAPGLVSGALAPCPDKPNCVCSEFDEDTAHLIAPIDYSAAPPEGAWGDILQIIQELDGQVVVSNEGYVAATFSSSLFGFIDDLECRLDSSGRRIQIRSASRVGHSDLGVNRKRVEAMTRSFDQMRRGANQK